VTEMVKLMGQQELQRRETSKLAERQRTIREKVGRLMTTSRSEDRLDGGRAISGEDRVWFEGRAGASAV